jgi:hypothetical protein
MVVSPHKIWSKLTPNMLCQWFWRTIAIVQCTQISTDSGYLAVGDLRVRIRAAGRRDSCLERVDYAQREKILSRMNTSHCGHSASCPLAPATWPRGHYREHRHFPRRATLWPFYDVAIARVICIRWSPENRHGSCHQSLAPVISSFSDRHRAKPNSPATA